MSAEQLAALLGRVPGLAAALEGHGHLVGWLRYGVPRGRGPADLALLARVLASPAGLEATLGALTLTELQVLLLAHWTGGALQREAALAEAGARPGSPQAVALDRAAASLHALLLSDGARGWVVLRPGVEGGLALPGVTLRDGLRHWPSEAVAARLRAIGVAAADVPPRRSERVDLLVAALREPEIARALVADLPEAAARVLARLRQEGFVRVRDLGVAWYSGQRPAYYPETSLDALVARGLAGVDEVQQLAFVWLDVAVALNGGRLFTSWPEAPQPTPRPLERQAVAVPAVVAQLDRLLRVWEAEPAPALQDGGLGVRPVRAAARALGLPDGVVGLLAGLAIGLGLLGTVSQGMVGRGRQRREILSWSPTRAAQAWASEPAEERWSRLVAAWLDSDLVDEREGLPERCDPAARESGARPARAELLALLVDLDEGYGLALAELVDVAALRRPRLLEGCVAGLTAAARALGLVPPAGPVGLTDLARRLLHGGPAAARAALPTPSREFVVQADHTVIAPPDLHPEVAATLERYAELESDAGARVYRLTERRLGQALVDGDDGEAIAAFLDEHSRTPVPQNVAYLVADCARRHGRLRAGESRSYLRSEDPGLLTAAAAVRSARLRVLAPTVAISSLPRDKLVAALAARGVVAVPEDARRCGDRGPAPPGRPALARRAGRHRRPAFQPAPGPAGAAGDGHGAGGRRPRHPGLVTAYENALIVQSDLTVLLEVASPKAGDARAALARFAELEKSPEHVHTYRISPLSLWNAAAAGVTADEVCAALDDFAKYPVPPSVLTEVRDQLRRFGRLKLVRDFDTGGLALTSAEPALLAEVVRDKAVAALLGDRLDGNRWAVRLGDRGALKQALLRLGWPPSDEAGYVEGAALDVPLACTLRTYQSDAVAAWWADGSAAGGNGVLVLPCGAGKTVDRAGRDGAGGVAHAGDRDLDPGRAPVDRRGRPTRPAWTPTWSASTAASARTSGP